jgi:hypothetical protein
MKNLIREILKEEFEDLSWIEEIPSAEKWFQGSRPRYIGRPKSYTKNPTPMEKLLIKLDLAMEAEEPVDGSYSYGLQRYVSDDESLEDFDNNIGTKSNYFTLRTVLLDNDLKDDKSLIVWLGDLRPKQRLLIFQKLKNMGFRFKSGNNHNAKPNVRHYIIIIDPKHHNLLDLGRTTNFTADGNNLSSSKNTHRIQYQRHLDGGFYRKHGVSQWGGPKVAEYDVNNLINKL